MKATGCKKIYNAENIIEAEMLVEMLKENGIAAFTQEPSSSVAAYGVVANLSIVAFAIFNGLAQGAQPLISESYGKGQPTQVRKLLK